MGAFSLHKVYQLALYTAFYFSFIYVFLLRTFLLLWNFKYTQATSRLVWKKTLTPGYEGLDNIYIRNNHLFGDFNNSGPCSILTWIIAVFCLPLSTN